MGVPYFRFKGVDSSAYLIVSKLPPITKAEKDISKIPVPGRDGALFQDNGSYKIVPKVVECSLLSTSNIEYICSWLTGAGDAIFSNEPDRAYKAIIINQIPFEKVVGVFHKFIIQFECQPHKYAATNTVVTKTVSPATLTNPGTANSKPIIKVFGTGSIDLNINGNVIHLTNVVDYVTIDSDIVDCFKDTAPKNNYMVGEFPELVPGVNTITWAGTVTKLEITPNYRYV